MAREWENFEKECFDFIKTKLDDCITCEHQGVSDSTKSDIYIKCPNGNYFYIEVKSPNSQCGQFVLKGNAENKSFYFSEQNKTTENDYTQIIAKHMTEKFDIYYASGTAGNVIDLPNDVFYGWIKDYYLNKNVKYFITKSKDFIIFPTEEFDKYFSVVAKYRIKKSGSDSPSKACRSSLIEYLKSKLQNIIEIKYENKRLFLKLAGKPLITKLHFYNYDYKLTYKEDNQLYEVRKLSNTRNANVIFEIRLKDNLPTTDNAENFIQNLENGLA